jgi:hypothetical protein
MLCRFSGTFNSKNENVSLAAENKTPTIQYT